MTAVDAPAPEIEIGPREAIAALRTIRFGGGDASTLTLEVSPAARAAIGPMVNAARWGAVLFAMVFAAPEAFDGSLAAAGSVAIAVWWTSWRSFRPLMLASAARGARMFAIVDAAIFAIGAGITGGLESPFAPTMVVAAAVAAFGWGLGIGTIAAAAGLVVAPVAAAVFDAESSTTSQQALSIVAVTAAIVIVATAVQGWLRDSERRRRVLAAQVESLSETNDLLTMLNRAARSLPGRLDPREVGDAIAAQLQAGFAPDALAVLEVDPSGSLSRLVASGVPMPSVQDAANVAPEFNQILASRETIRFEPAGGRSMMGLALRTRERTVGLVALWVSGGRLWSERDARGLAGLQEVLALSLDNARRFGQLRAMGAADERERVARELHDRLGQVLTVVSMELERVIDGEPTGDLERVYDDVQRSIDELRETLRTLRTNISEEEGLAERGAQLADDVRVRAGVPVSFTAVGSGPRPPAGVEQEFLRIMQEAVNNAVKHAAAASIAVRYETNPRQAAIAITDDGAGFDLSKPTRSDAWGLRGMVERAASVEADLAIDSVPGVGTTVRATWEDDDD